MTNTQNPPVTATRRGNPVGVVAMIVSIVGFVLSFIPLALLFTGVLLPAGLILGVIGVALPRRKKWHAITAIVVAVLGAVAVAVMFFVVFLDGGAGM